MPTPRYKEIKLTANGKTLVAFYAGRNAAGMKEDAHTQFFRVFGQNAIDGGVEGYEYAEKHFNGEQMRFHDTIRSYDDSRIEYTPKVEGIGERWIILPETQDVAEPVFGNNGGAGVPPSLDPFDGLVEGITEEIQTVFAGAAAAPSPDPDTFETVQPPTIDSPVEQEPPPAEPERQKHEITHPASGQRITFETEGDPDWGGQEIPEGYKRIDGDTPIESGNVNPGELVGEPGDVIETDAAMYTRNDIIALEGSLNRGVNPQYGLPYGEMDYSKGDARYISEDGKLDRPQEFGDSEYERARNNIRPVPWEGDPYVGTVEAVPNTHDAPKNDKSKVDQDEIDTGKLRNPENMRREIEELRGDPTTSETQTEQKDQKRTTGVHTHMGGSIPAPGRRSNAMFGVQPQ